MIDLYYPFLYLSVSVIVFVGIIVILILDISKIKKDLENNKNTIIRLTKQISILSSQTHAPKQSNPSYDNKGKKSKLIKPIEWEY